MKGIFMKEDKEIEQILLNDSNYEKFVNKKIEKEFTQEIESTQKKEEPKVITNISLVPKEKLFSKDATYIVMNKKSKTKSYINGIQTDGFLGSQKTLREKCKKAEVDYFSSGENYVKFYRIKL